MSRLLFTKEGVSVWSSHLDLMRALMRSFRRAGIDLKHSQGFTPHPELSILMPLSVGVESQCEIAEFTLAEGCEVPVGEIAPRMNPVLPAGIRALESYEGGLKAGKLAWLRARLELSYSPVGAANGRQPEAEADEMQNAKCKMQNEGSGIRHQASGDEGTDSSTPLRSAQNDGQGTLVIEAVVAAQNPTLNPLLLVTAIEKYLPEHRPEHVVCRRLEIYDQDMNVFR